MKLESFLVILLPSIVVSEASRLLYRDNSGESIRVSEQDDGPTSTDLDNQYACQLIIGAHTESADAARGKEQRLGQIGISEMKASSNKQYATWFNFPVNVRTVMIKPGDFVSAKFVALQVARIRSEGRGETDAGSVIDYEMPFNAQITEVTVKPNDDVPRRRILFKFIEVLRMPEKEQRTENERHLVRHYDCIHGDKQA